MTQDFTDMIYLFSCGALGICPQLDHDINFDKIYRLACEQNVWDIVFLAVKKMYESGKLSITPELFSNLKGQTIAAVIANTNRLYLIHQMTDSFLQKGIRYCILKGETLSYLYNDHNCRISSDTDIFINKTDKETAIDVLEQHGYVVKPLNTMSNQIHAIHPIAGFIEVHLALYNEISADVWFDNKILITEDYRLIKCDDGKEIFALGINDGLVFLALHYIKHFLSRGVGIRQLMDLLLYVRKYKKDIDWERFNQLLEHLNYKKFFDNSIGIGVKYLNIKEEDMPEYRSDDSIIGRLLSDIESGGVFGGNEDSRIGFSYNYTKERFHRFKNEDYNTYIKRWNKPGLLNLIFPRTKQLAANFPYICKSPILYPVAWLHRIIRLFISLIRKEKSVKKYKNYIIRSDEIDKRMELIKELDMI
jgi:hypothetical protein